MVGYGCTSTSMVVQYCTIPAVRCTSSGYATRMKSAGVQHDVRVTFRPIKLNQDDGSFSFLPHISVCYPVRYRYGIVRSIASSPQPPTNLPIILLVPTSLTAKEQNKIAHCFILASVWQSSSRRISELNTVKLQS